MSQQSLRPLWVYFLLNGDQNPQNGVKVNIATVTDLPSLFQKATDSLNLNQLDVTSHLQLSRVFSSEGIEIKTIDQIYADDRLYFSCGEDYDRPETEEQQETLNGDNNGQNGSENAGNGYLYTAAVFTSGLLSTTYGAFSHAVRTHASQRVINTFNSIEEGVQYYSNPVVQTTLPYLSSGITWSDQMLNQTIAVTTQKTNEFLQTPTGQKMTQLKDNVADYTSKAVASFQAATTGSNNNSGDNQPNGENINEAAQQQQQTYLENFKQSMGHQWNEVLVPWALATYHNLHEQLQQQQGGPQGPTSPQQQEQQPQQEPQQPQQ